MGVSTMRVIGLMSGTSLDGVDAAWIETDGETVFAQGPALTVPYEEGFRARLRGVLGLQAATDEIRAVERDLTLLHADAVRRLRLESGAETVDLVGFHGHTIMHRPRERRTWQIGDGALLASETGLPVVSDFRSADVEAGGQGAPLAPAYHRALAGPLAKPVAVLNIGGVGNVTWIGEGSDDILAFDTGPGNALLDDWSLRHTGVPCDTDGALALGGRPDGEIVRRFLSHPYFSVPAPKSLDRNDFAHLLPHSLSPADGAATLVAITVGAIARAAEQFPAPPLRWLVTGGGRHNPAIMQALQEILRAPIMAVEDVGWRGDALEAQAFGYLAVRSARGLALSFPGTTGIAAPLTGGVAHRSIA